MDQYKALRVIISGGGTGGHIFPAISIANCLKELNPHTEILFVGAKGKMEMEKVPEAGYKIEGLSITGLQRSLKPKAILHNLKVPFLTMGSKIKARRLIKNFAPDIAIGVGGYASAPLLFAAESLKVPCLLQEQNSFAGLANKMLSAKADRICVAYEGMEKFFPADRIVITGNPIRSSIRPVERKQTDGIRHLLIIGGSLGARTLNEAMCTWILAGCPGQENVEILWQCGKLYKAKLDKVLADARAAGHGLKNIVCTDFIADIDKEYAQADLVISRAGASSVSELCAAHKATVFVPSPNVAEDHQTHNAMALVNKNAAIMVRDAEAVENLLSTALNLIKDEKRIHELEKNIATLALPDAARSIADEIYKTIKK